MATPPSFTLGVSYWSMPGGQAHTLDVADAASQAASAGFDAIELCIAEGGALAPTTDRDACAAFRNAVDAAGLTLETLASDHAWGCNPTSDDPAVRERSIRFTAAALQRAAWLGCTSLLYVPGIVTCPWVPGERIPYDVALQRVRDNLAQLLPIADRVGVELCLENVWNGMLLSPVELVRFIDDCRAAFGSDRLGVYLDLGNLLGYHQHPPHWIAALGDRLRRVHVKDFRAWYDGHGCYDFCRLGEGDMPWAATAAALRDIGYDRTLIAEMLPPAPGLLEHTAKHMRATFG